MDQLDRDRQLAGDRREPAADLGRERDAHRPEVLAAEVEQVVGGALDRAWPARDLIEVVLDVGELGRDPAAQLAEARGQLVAAVAPAHPAEVVEEGLGGGGPGCGGCLHRHGSDAVSCFKDS